MSAVTFTVLVLYCFTNIACLPSLKGHNNVPSEEFQTSINKEPGLISAHEPDIEKPNSESKLHISQWSSIGDKDSDISEAEEDDDDDDVETAFARKSIRKFSNLFRKPLPFNPSSVPCTDKPVNAISVEPYRQIINPMISTYSNYPEANNPSYVPLSILYPRLNPESSDQLYEYMRRSVNPNLLNVLYPYFNQQVLTNPAGMINPSANEISTTAVKDINSNLNLVSGNSRGTLFYPNSNPILANLDSLANPGLNSLGSANPGLNSMAFNPALLYPGGNYVPFIPGTSVDMTANQMFRNYINPYYQTPDNAQANTVNGFYPGLPQTRISHLNPIANPSQLTIGDPSTNTPASNSPFNPIGGGHYPYIHENSLPSVNSAYSEPSQNQSASLDNTSSQTYPSLFQPKKTGEHDLGKKVADSAISSDPISNMIGAPPQSINHPSVNNMPTNFVHTYYPGLDKERYGSTNTYLNMPKQTSGNINNDFLASSNTNSHLANGNPGSAKYPYTNQWLANLYALMYFNSLYANINNEPVINSEQVGTGTNFPGNNPIVNSTIRSPTPTAASINSSSNFVDNVSDHMSASYNNPDQVVRKSINNNLIFNDINSNAQQNTDNSEIAKPNEELSNASSAYSSHSADTFLDVENYTPDSNSVNAPSTKSTITLSDSNRFPVRSADSNFNHDKFYFKPQPRNQRISDFSFEKDHIPTGFSSEKRSLEREHPIVNPYISNPTVDPQKQPSYDSNLARLYLERSSNLITHMPDIASGGSDQVDSSRVITNNMHNLMNSSHNESNVEDNTTSDPLSRHLISGREKIPVHFDRSNILTHHVDEHTEEPWFRPSTEPALYESSNRPMDLTSERDDHIHYDQATDDPLDLVIKTYHSETTSTADIPSIERIDREGSSTQTYQASSHYLDNISDISDPLDEGPLNLANRNLTRSEGYQDDRSELSSHDIETLKNFAIRYLGIDSNTLEELPIVSSIDLATRNSIAREGSDEDVDVVNVFADEAHEELVSKRRRLNSNSEKYPPAFETTQNPGESITDSYKTTSQPSGYLKSYYDFISKKSAKRNRFLSNIELVRNSSEFKTTTVSNENYNRKGLSSTEASTSNIGLSRRDMEHTNESEHNTVLPPEQMDDIIDLTSDQTPVSRRWVPVSLTNSDGLKLAKKSFNYLRALIIQRIVAEYIDAYLRSNKRNNRLSLTALWLRLRQQYTLPVLHSYIQKIQSYNFPGDQFVLINKYTQICDDLKEHSNQFLTKYGHDSAEELDIENEFFYNYRLFVRDVDLPMLMNHLMFYAVKVDEDLDDVFLLLEPYIDSYLQRFK